MSKQKILGVLDTDILVAELAVLIDNYTQMFQRFFNTIDPEISVRRYSVIEGEYPENIDDCDAYVITGSKYSAYDDLAWIGVLQDFIKTLYEREKKLLGVCFGHQLIAQTLGGRVEKCAEGWGVGAMDYDVQYTAPWMVPELERITLLASHQDQVVELPPNAQRIAGNDFCPNAAYHIESRVLGFQPHPEFTYEYSKKLMHHRAICIGKERMQLGLASLGKPIDDKAVGQWLVNFLL